MSKKRLVFLGGTDFTSNYISNIVKEYYDIENYNFLTTYDNKSCVFIITDPRYLPQLNLDQSSVISFLEQGFKLVILNAWEARPFFLIEQFKPYVDQILLIVGCKNPFDVGWKNVIGVERWFWYNESLWYTQGDLGYVKDHYTPDRINNHLFFMPMKRQKPHRTAVRNRLVDFLDQSIYSYVEAWENPRSLPTLTEQTATRVAPDRVFESTWYDQTYFSIVVETAVDRLADIQDEIDGKRPQEVACELFVTEKTFKPIAFQHPFMICGMQGILKFLKDNGFETFDHIFDERYDQLESFTDRLEIIYNNIKTFNKETYSNPITEQKIKHNHNLFYNIDRVTQGIKDDILIPMVEWTDAE